MTFKDMLKNDEAVSVSIGFILTLSITIIVFSAIVLSFYALSTQSEKAAMRESFKTSGSGLAVKITTVDTLVNITGSYGGTVNTIEYGFSMPESVAGKSYTVNITNSTYEIAMESDNGARIVVPFRTSINFNGIKIYSGAEDYMLRYYRDGNSIGIEE